MDYSNWAHRRASRGGQKAAPPPASAPARAQEGIAAPPGPPPVGYAWALNPQYGYILVPLQTQQEPPLVPPPRQPNGVRPFVQQPLTSAFPPGHGTTRIETCVLVKPGDKDTYAEMMAGVPDLVPDNGGYDAMAGNPSPMTVREAGQVPEFRETQDGQVLGAYPEGARLISGKCPPLTK